MERVLEANLAIGPLYTLDALPAGVLHEIQIVLPYSGQDISYQILLHRQLEQQTPDPAAQCTQLALQHIGKDAGQILVRSRRVQVPE